MHGQHQHLAFRGVRQRLPGDIHPVQPGHRRHIAEHWPIRDAQESASREDHRRVSNAAQVEALTTLAMAAATSVVCAGIVSGWSRKRH
jgi:hypothetical protein